MKRLVSLFAVLAIVTVGMQSVVVAQPADAAARAAAIDWGRCDARFLRQAGAQCAMLTVPLDHDDPSGETIQIALSRIRHTVPRDEYQGVMLVNPGGPGGSGLGLVTLGQYVPRGVGEMYDWIGFDPRGVGSSEPALSCIPNYFRTNRPPYVPTSQDIIDHWLARAERYAAACGEAAPELLPHMKTTDVAMDVEAIRMALGVEQINYYGFSYGTYLGQVYATLSPDRLRRAVFDANVDPTQVWYDAYLAQDVAFQGVIELWFEWLADHHRVYHLGRTAEAVAARWEAELARLTADPARGEIGGAEWADAFLFAAYCECLWAYLGDVFSAWVHDRNYNLLLETYLGTVGFGDDNGYAVYLAVECTDAPWPLDWETWEADNWAIHEQSPFFTWGNAWFNAPCLFWPEPAGEPVDVGSDNPVLLISETEDAATPFEGSLQVRREFPNAVLIAVEGGATHAGSLFGNRCVDRKIARYLATGALPERQPGDGPDVVCDRLPFPEPAASTLKEIIETIRVTTAA